MGVPRPPHACPIGNRRGIARCSVSNGGASGEETSTQQDLRRFLRVRRRLQSSEEIFGVELVGSLEGDLRRFSRSLLVSPSPPTSALPALPLGLLLQRPRPGSRADGRPFAPGWYGDTSPQEKGTSSRATWPGSLPPLALTAGLSSSTGEP